MDRTAGQEVRKYLANPPTPSSKYCETFKICHALRIGLILMTTKSHKKTLNQSCVKVLVTVGIIFN